MSPAALLCTAIDNWDCHYFFKILHIALSNAYCMFELPPPAVNNLIFSIKKFKKNLLYFKI